MELIQLLLAAIILGMVYKKMLRWEAGAGITRKQALLPIGLGVLSTILSVACTIGISYNLMRMGYSLTDIQNPLAQALVIRYHSQYD